MTRKQPLGWVGPLDPKERRPRGRSSRHTGPSLDSAAHITIYRLHRDTAEAAYLSVSVAAAAHSVGGDVDGDAFGSSIGDAFPSCPLFDSLSVDAVRAFTRASASLVHRSLPRAALRRHDGRASASPSARRRRPRVETPQSSTKALGSAASVMSAVVVARERTHRHDSEGARDDHRTMPLKAGP
eukprot:gene17455-20063_t